MIWGKASAVTGLWYERRSMEAWMDRVPHSQSERSSLLSPEDPAWEADKRRPGAPAEAPQRSWALRGAGPQRRLPELTWCPTVFLCSLAVWPGLPLVGFEGVRVRGVRPEEVAEVGLTAFSSSWNNSGNILNWVRNSKRKSHSKPKLKWKSLQKH